MGSFPIPLSSIAAGATADYRRGAVSKFRRTP